MSNEYQIGKDIQDLKHRVEALERELRSKCRCESVSIVAFTTAEEVTINEINLLEKTFTWGKETRGDCEWTSHTVKIYSDGTYREIARLHNTGFLFGNRLITNMFAMDGGRKDLAFWNWVRGVDAGEYVVYEGEGFEGGIRDNFASIAFMGRNLGCVN